MKRSHNHPSHAKKATYDGPATDQFSVQHCNPGNVFGSAFRFRVASGSEGILVLGCYSHLYKYSRLSWLLEYFWTQRMLIDMAGGNGYSKHPTDDAICESFRQINWTLRSEACSGSDLRRG